MIASRRARALFFMYACETSSIVLGFHPTVRLRGIAIIEGPQARYGINQEGWGDVGGAVPPGKRTS